MMPARWQSMPDSAAPSPVSGKSHFNKAIRAHPAWTAYLTAHAKFMVSQDQQPIIQIENVGSSNKSAGHTPKTIKGSQSNAIQSKRNSYTNQHGERYKHHPRGCLRITE